MLHWNWKRILLELMLETLMELCPGNLCIMAAVAEYLVDFSLEHAGTSIHLVFSGNGRKYAQSSSVLSQVQLAAPSFT